MDVEILRMKNLYLVYLPYGFAVSDISDAIEKSQENKEPWKKYPDFIPKIYFYFSDTNS